MFSVSVHRVHQSVAEDYDRVDSHKEVPVVPDSSQLVEIAVDEVFDNISLKVTGHQAKDEHVKAQEITIKGELADRDGTSKLDSEGVDKEDYEASPCVRVASSCCFFHSVLENDSHAPDADNAEGENGPGSKRTIDPEKERLIRHAADGIEEQVATEASLDTKVAEVVHHHLAEVVETVPILRAEHREHQLLVSAVERDD